MNTYEKIINLDVDTPDYSTVVYAKQNDNLNRKLLVILKVGGAAFTKASGDVAVFRYTRPDGTNNIASANILSNGFIEVTFDEQLLAVPGKIVCDVEISNGGTHRLSTPLFIVQNDKSPTGETQIAKLDDYQLLLQTVAKATVDNARLNELIESGTPEGAEVIDIRVGADGHVYSTAGEAVRGQVDEINLSIANSLTTSIEALRWEIGTITVTGLNTNVRSYARTKDYYPCANIQTCKFTGVVRGEGETLDRNCFFAYYDAEKNFVERTASYTSGHAYMRIVYGFDTETDITVDDYGLTNLVNDFDMDITGKRLAVEPFSGGTLVANQPINTFCYIPSIQNITDVPSELKGLNIYAFLETLGSRYKIQRMTTSYGSYQRVFNASIDAWLPWITLQSTLNNPVYVALGASTTEGRVHHFAPQITTVSKNAYPQFVGKALGLETHNLAIGSTGFMCRGTLTDTTSSVAEKRSRNFMDVIYDASNNDLFNNASLITLQFGYGNDKTPIPNDDTVFPIGGWNDYYPYDADGYHPMTNNLPTLSENLTARKTTDIHTMLEKGATLMGCLNWCVKWLQEHYPQAVLIVIYGSPSANIDYPVEIVSNGSEDYGVPPYKISVAERDADDGLSGKVRKLARNLGFILIDEENDGNPFTYYTKNAVNEDGTYKVWSTTDTPENPKFNSHPNDEGYLVYARYTAGKIVSLFTR